MVFNQVKDLVESLKTTVENPNKESIENYAAYCMRLKLEKNKDKSIKNTWMQKKTVDELDVLYRRVLNEGLDFDGKHVTLGNRGISYDYQAYKNKMMLVYPETIIDIELVYKTDEFSFQKDSGKVGYNHKFGDPFTRKDDDIVGGYLLIKNKRGEFLTTLTKADFEKHRKVAKTDYIWKAWYKEMCLKTLMRKGVKYHFDDDFKEMNVEDNKEIDLDQVIPVDDLQEIKKQVNEALNLYTEDDKDEIRNMCIEKSKSGEFDIVFGRLILERLNDE